MKSSPEGADIFLGGAKLNNTTPDVLSGLLPQDYVLKLEKDGFYSYQMPIRLRPSSVAEFNIILIPKIKHVDKLEFDFNIYKYFISKHFYGNKIIAFTDSGIYYLDDDFKNDKKISSQDLGKPQAGDIEGAIEGDNKLVFWSNNTVRLLETDNKNSDEENGKVVSVYAGTEFIKDVFFGLKERYLLIQDGLKIIALDAEDPVVYYPILKLNDKNSKIFYDSGAETLYIYDKITGTETFTLYKAKLRHLIYERDKQEKVP